VRLGAEVIDRPFVQSPVLMPVNLSSTLPVSEFHGQFFFQKASFTVSPVPSDLQSVDASQKFLN